MPEDVLRSILSGVQLLEQELLYFAAFWFVLGALDEFAVDCVWLALRIFHKEPVAIGRDTVRAGAIAVFIAAWKESEVIGHTIGHALRVWQQRDLRLYVGCYGNDPATVAAAMAGAAGDPRLRIVIHDRPGPTTKADCLNRVYRAMCADENRERRRFAGVVMHDAEQVVSVVQAGRSQKTAACARRALSG